MIIVTNFQYLENSDENFEVVAACSGAVFMAHAFMLSLSYNMTSKLQKK